MGRHLPLDWPTPRRPGAPRRSLATAPCGGAALLGGTCGHEGACRCSYESRRGTRSTAESRCPCRRHRPPPWGRCGPSPSSPRRSGGRRSTVDGTEPAVATPGHGGSPSGLLSPNYNYAVNVIAKCKALAVIRTPGRRLLVQHWVEFPIHLPLDTTMAHAAPRPGYVETERIQLLLPAVGMERLPAGMLAIHEEPAHVCY